MDRGLPRHHDPDERDGILLSRRKNPALACRRRQRGEARHLNAGGELPGLVSGLRSLGNETPILNSWAGDGTYWVTSNPKVTNYFAVTYASIAGDDPSPAVNALAAQVKAGTGGFVTGAAAIDGIVAAIKRAGGSTNGAKLAAQMVKFKKVPTISGLVSFSTRYHSVFGRQYRVIEIQNNVLKRVGLVTASSPADIG